MAALPCETGPHEETVDHHEEDTDHPVETDHPVVISNGLQDNRTTTVETTTGTPARNSEVMLMVRQPTRRRKGTSYGETRVLGTTAPE